MSTAIHQQQPNGSTNSIEISAPVSRKSSTGGKSHSPYAHPAIRSTDMTDGNTTTQVGGNGYYGCSSGSSNSSENGENTTQQSSGSYNPHRSSPNAQQQTAPARRPYNTGSAPPPPSYVQATIGAAREWTSTPNSDSEQQQNSGTPEETTSPAYHNSNSNNNQHQVTYSNQSNVQAPNGAYHAQLFGKCEWIQPPPVPLVEQPTPTFPCYRLFLGQIRFETTPAEVKWIVEYVTGVQALKVESRGIGCFLAYFQHYEDMTAVQALHKRILFDHTGIWFARTDEQSSAMQMYVKQALGRIGRGFRLPKDMMVVEEEKLQRALPIPSSPPHYSSTYSSFQQQGGLPQNHGTRVFRSNSGGSQNNGSQQQRWQGNNNAHQQQQAQPQPGAHFPSHNYSHSPQQGFNQLPEYDQYQ